MNTFEKDKTYITHTYNRYPVCFVKGEGSHLYDDKGKEYIDMGTGIGVDVLGISYEPWIEAVTKQLHTLNHVSNLFYTMPQTDLAQALCEKLSTKNCARANMSRVIVLEHLVRVRPALPSSNLSNWQPIVHADSKQL